MWRREAGVRVRGMQHEKDSVWHLPALKMKEAFLPQIERGQSLEAGKGQEPD